MEFKNIHDKYILCCQLVTTQRIAELFPVLQELVAETHNSDLITELESHKETYSNILTYSFGKFEDPEKKTVYHRLLRNIIHLADNALETIMATQHVRSFYTIKNNPALMLTASPEEAQHFIETLSWYSELNKLGKDYKPEDDSLSKEQQQKRTQLFNQLWLTNKYTDSEKNLATFVFQSESLPWWNKCLVVSAITLSLQRYFDEAKFELLIMAYQQTDAQTAQRALTGLLITLYQYNQRLFLYPKIKEQLTHLSLSSPTQKQVESIIIQFIKSKDTEKIAEKFRNEIYPEMEKIQSRIYNKLDLKNIIKDPISDEKNPDWEHVFNDSPDLLSKLEELSMLQMDGSDVFMSTFSMLKHFDFFNEISNWFIPFHKENPDLLDALNLNDENFDTQKFLLNMEQSSVMCNSDKYSFGFNVKLIPARDRSMMMEMFSMETKAMEEMAHDDDMLNKPTREKVIFAQYIQDLYRFNKLYRYKQEFYDIFTTRTDFHNTTFLQWIINDEKIIRNISEFLFAKEHYSDAIEIFSQIDNLPGNFELWQKIAYSWQKLGNYQKALEYYLQADLTDIRKPWNIKKIALCYRRLGNYKKALEYYIEAEKLEPENLQLQTNLAHTYLDLKDYENALKIYFKVEYLAPDNHKIQRPIAWCSFMLEKPDTAKKYFEKTIQSEETQNDLLNLGHIEWCLGNKQEAIERYKQSLLKAGNNFTWFAEEFMADSDILIRYGIDSFDIPLMRDYIKISSIN